MISQALWDALSEEQRQQLLFTKRSPYTMIFSFLSNPEGVVTKTMDIDAPTLEIAAFMTKDAIWANRDLGLKLEKVEPKQTK